MNAPRAVSAMPSYQSIQSFGHPRRYQSIRASAGGVHACPLRSTALTKRRDACLFTVAWASAVELSQFPWSLSTSVITVPRCAGPLKESDDRLWRVALAHSIEYHSCTHRPYLSGDHEVFFVISSDLSRDLEELVGSCSRPTGCIGVRASPCLAAYPTQSDGCTPGALGSARRRDDTD